MKTISIICLLALMTNAVFCQSPFKKFDFLIGNWQGVETGMAGDGIGFRTYDYELNMNYLVVRNSSTFPITEKKTEG